MFRGANQGEGVKGVDNEKPDERITWPCVTTPKILGAPNPKLTLCQHLTNRLHHYTIDFYPSAPEIEMPAKPLRRPVIEGAIAYIPLTRGFYALVDADYAEIVCQWNWFARTKSHGSRNTYAVRTDYDGSKQATIQMHSLIRPPRAGLVVDHVNGNTLDNRRVNLRYATRAQNTMNRPMPRKSDGERGTYQLPNGRWRAIIGANGERVYLGVFATHEEARAAYVEAAKQMHGRFAYLK